MGRTIAPYSIQLQMIEARLGKFRRALRKPDQELLDELLRFAKKHVQAGVLASNPNPNDSILLAMLIEQQRQLHELRRQVEGLKPETIKQSDNGDKGIPV